MKLRKTIVAGGLAAASLLMMATPAGAINQTFGSHQGGSNWIIGTYYRDGVYAGVPYEVGVQLPVERVQASNAGGFGFTTIARAAVLRSAGNCARALGVGSGPLTGDAWCSAV